ncbi:MAG TPA: RagB/SusD family nutrient uptake outer membrane protein [Gemmatimonadaceae bacterium]|nr:RagB/SusD family nutrient uptake outer membrane protein [Gemmatimonadaceae bacterium]
MTSNTQTREGSFMRNKTLRAALASLLLGGAITACNQELELTNPNQPSTNSFWQTQADAILGINATYNGLMNNGTYGRWEAFVFDLRSDEGMVVSPWTELSNFTKFTQSDYNFEVPREVWQHHYQTIFRANQVVDRVPEINMDATMRSRIVGEAKFIRGLLYYNLVNLFGSVPLIVRTAEPTDRPASAGEADIYTQIEKDLNDASGVLPTAYSGGDVGRATKGAALAMLGKAQLQRRNWSAAATTLASVIAIPGYDLMANYADNFTDKFENNKESVFEVQFGDETQLSAGVRGLNIPKMIGPCGGPSYCDGRPTRWFFDQFMIEKTVTGGVDPRLDATLFYNYPGATVYGVPFLANGRGPNDIFFKKYGEYYIPNNDQNWDNPINYRVIRFADVLLMEAEALNELGNTAGAYQFINRVRARAQLAPLPAGLTQAQMRDRILKERLLEFGLEAQRWNDLKRHNLLSKSLAVNDPEYNFFVPGKSENLPIPQTEIDLNPNVRQNPGW